MAENRTGLIIGIVAVIGLIWLFLKKPAPPAESAEILNVNLT